MEIRVLTGLCCQGTGKSEESSLDTLGHGEQTKEIETISQKLKTWFWPPSEGKRGRRPRKPLTGCCCQGKGKCQETLPHGDQTNEKETFFQKLKKWFWPPSKGKRARRRRKPKGDRQLPREEKTECSPSPTSTEQSQGMVRRRVCMACVLKSWLEALKVDKGLRGGL